MANKAKGTSLDLAEPSDVIKTDMDTARYAFPIVSQCLSYCLVSYQRWRD